MPNYLLYVLSTVAWVILASMFIPRGPWPQARDQTEATGDDSRNIVCGRPGVEPGRFRAKFGGGPGVFVYGWPSNGGVYVLYPSLGIELDFLGLDRFQETPRLSLSDEGARADEEAHCNKMRQLGAGWWSSEYEHDYSLITGAIADKGFTYVGWPAGGGVWVLKMPEMEAMAAGTAAIYNSYTMEERCKAIEKLGGVFYPDPNDCPYLDLSA